MSSGAAVLVSAAACGRLGFQPAGAGPDAPATWQLLEVSGVYQGSTISVGPSPGALFVVAIEEDVNDTVIAVSDDAGDTFAPIPAAHASYSGTPGGTPGSAIDLWFAAGVPASARTITVALNTASAPRALVVWDVANLAAASPLDTAIALSDRPASSSPASPQIATARAGEFVIAIADSPHTVTGSHPGGEFTNDLSTYGDGWAHLTDPQAPPGLYQAVWDADVADTYCTAAAAFLPAR